jgi:N-glycosylase/DNA lyase
MNIQSKDNSIILKDVSDFSISQTLECGQCFHFYCIGVDEYIVIAHNRMLHIKQIGNEVTFFNTTRKEYDEIWENYFDLSNDYSKIKEYLMKQDEQLIPAIKDKSGVRILNQEFSETLMSFIISQTKQIPQIKQVVNTISNRFGSIVGTYEDTTYYAFPTIEELKKITVEDFLECKAGFRAPYLVAAAQFLSNDMNALYFSDYSYEEAKKILMGIKGVGEKVANCVLLFSLGYRNAFPVDVWIKRTMEELYFHKDTPKDVIQKFGEEKFGKYGGYAQQYLFYFGKTTLKK